MMIGFEGLTRHESLWRTQYSIRVFVCFYIRRKHERIKIELPQNPWWYLRGDDFDKKMCPLYLKTRMKKNLQENLICGCQMTKKISQRTNTKKQKIITRIYVSTDSVASFTDVARSKEWLRHEKKKKEPDFFLKTWNTQIHWGEKNDPTNPK